ncbi:MULTISPECIES: response regulator [Kribbella]|uniref:DNA-binding NarL/FixJ family response regulator n=2 Tax=Kribbella TaxID=182639 RepID=A0A841E1K0_9ACTN|nr:response regulator transcription factor [Kribbella solani]MBB5982287.1 DNA-binding NarL/FixJ family response regulator [Kribbella solani]MDX2968481.1 response regulator transcription factor [Kribbella solani]MDX3003840.1 response regulator transcription factor [Kribbella solani]
MIKVMVVDDQDLVRDGISMILDGQPDIEVVAQAVDGADAIRQAAAVLDLGVVLMDVRMPVMDGIEATRRLVAGPNAPRVVILTTFDLDEYVYDALRAGASGFLLKRSSRDDLINAVRVIAGGDALLAPPVTRRLLDRFADNRLDPTVTASLDVLTAREREVLELVAKGNSNQEIAAELHLTEHTVKTHVSRMLAKCGLRDRVQAVILAYDAGLVSAGRK